MLVVADAGLGERAGQARRPGPRSPTTSGGPVTLHDRRLVADGVGDRLPHRGVVRPPSNVLPRLLPVRWRTVTILAELPMTRLRLSVLDQSPIPDGATPADAVANTIDLARAADRLGYTRYWVAEHHSSPALASASPEILIGHLASATERIRVGSGAVMLPHYRPLKIAEQFRMLHTLHPGRIDLGIGRAPGSDAITASAIGNMASNIDRFPDDVIDLVGWLEGRHHPDHPHARIVANPAGEGAPEIWMTGSSAFGGALAAEIGLPFSFAHFINPEIGVGVVEAYRERFRPLVTDVPRANVGVSVLCADTDEEAERLAASVQVWRWWRNRGRFGPIPSADEARDVLHAADQKPWRAGEGRMLLGSPDRVRADLEDLCQRYGVDEAMVVTICHDHAARVHSYELLANAFDLDPSADSPPDAAGS